MVTTGQVLERPESAESARASTTSPAQVRKPVGGSRRPWREIAGVGLLIVAVLLVHGINIWQFPTANDDEGTYLAQAYAVRQGWGLAHYTYWYDHPPLAWIELAGLSWLPELILPDMLSVGAGRLSMLPVTAVSLALAYVLTRRLGFARWVGVFAVVLYGFSPLSVTLMRQVYLDGIATMWILAAFVLALSPRRQLWHYVGAGVAAAIGVLSKETILVVLPALLFTVWQATRGSVRRFSVAGFLTAFLLTCAYYPLYALLKGELLPGEGHVSMVGAWLFQLSSRDGSGSAFSTGTDAHGLVISWLTSDPVLVVAGLIAVAAGLAVRQLRGPAIAAAILIAVGLRPGGYLPAMYIIALLPFFAIMIACAVALAAGTVLEPSDRLRALGRRLSPRVGWAWPRLVSSSAGGRPGPRVEVSSRRLRLAALAVVAALGLGAVAPGWVAGDKYALTASHHDTYEAAAQWMTTQVDDKGAMRVVVDSTLWLDLVRNGYQREHVVWFYKLDVDPAVMTTIPHGYQDVDYLVATSVVRGDRSARPTLDLLFTNSVVVASFGQGDGRIDIRRIVKDAP